MDLIIGPHVGISYVTHPQAKPTRVTDFQNIERITTSILPNASLQKDNSSTNDATNGHSKSSNNAASNGSNGSSSKITNSPLSHKKTDKRSVTTCNCNEIKTLLKIKVAGNSDDLVITSNGVKTAESIADLVDGYCRLVNNTELSLWDRSTGRTPTGSATNSLEKQKQQLQQQKSDSIQPPLPPSNFSNPSENSRSDGLQQQQQQSSNVAKSSAAAIFEMNTPILSEDYVDIGLGEEEGDYSTPAARNYELDRSQITLNEIIGVGQFGDVHIGTCRINKSQKSSTKPDTNGEDSSQTEVASTTNGNENANENGSKSGVIHVAVKTCKADADMKTAEKFLEEACKCFFFLYDQFI